MIRRKGRQSAPHRRETAYEGESGTCPLRGCVGGFPGLGALSGLSVYNLQAKLWLSSQNLEC